MHRVQALIMLPKLIVGNNQMCVQFSTAEIERFQGVKRAFDAEGLLNPGKNIPTLHRCAEFGRMRVKGGQLPHPELPRF